MRRLGYDVELKQLGEHWRVNFRVRGVEHVVEPVNLDSNSLNTRATAGATRVTPLVLF